MGDAATTQQARSYDRVSLTGVPTRSAHTDPVATALDEVVFGLRGLASLSGATDSHVTEDLTALISAAREAVRARNPRDFDAVYLGAGPVARTLTAQTLAPAGARAADPVVQASLDQAHPISPTVTRDLLRLYITARRLGVADLNGVGALHRLGAVLAEDAGQTLLVRDGRRQPLAWSGRDNLHTSHAAGRLRVAPGDGAGHGL